MWVTIDHWTGMTQNLNVQFLKEVPVDDVKCFDHLRRLTKVMESSLNYQDFTILLAQRK